MSTKKITVESEFRTKAVENVGSIKPLEARYREAVVDYLMSFNAGKRLVPDDITKADLQLLPIELLEASVNTGTSFLTMRLKEGLIWFRPPNLKAVDLTYRVEDSELSHLDPEGHQHFCNVEGVVDGRRFFRQISASFYNSGLLVTFSKILSHHTDLGLSLQFQRFTEFTAQQVVQVTSKNVVGE